MAWNNKQPEIVVDTVIKRAEMGKIGRTLKTRLAFAQFKVARGWEDLSIDAIEPKVHELQRSKTNFSDEITSDSSSTTSSSDSSNRNSRCLMDSPIKDSAIFSDQIQWTNVSGSSSGFCKRRYHCDLEDSEFGFRSRKKHCSSPPICASNKIRYRNCHMSLSSPIKAQRHPHFTTTTGPSLSFYGSSNQTSQLFNQYNFESDDESKLPLHPSYFNSSPPHTSPSLRHRYKLNCNGLRNNREMREKGEDLLLYLATSPSPVVQRRSFISPSTPPPRNLTLPSSVMSTPKSTCDEFTGYGGPKTPSQAFDFSDYVNITPSPAQSSWHRTPRTTKTSGIMDRRRLNPDVSASPSTLQHT